jgi:peroxiredoxin/outer membrane lipoprotein-sorting protein
VLENIEMKLISLSITLLLATALPCLAAIPNTIPPIQALVAAKTISVTETCFLRNTDHRLAPSARMDVTFARPHKFSVSMVDISAGASKTVVPSRMVTDGSHVTEYVAPTGQYLLRTVSNAPTFRLSQILLVDFKGMINLLPTGFQEFPKTFPGTALTITQGSVDGQPARLLTETIPLKPDANMIVPSTRLWLSPKTGLPLQFVSYFVSKGKEIDFEKIEYANWQINKPVSDSTFAWTPPTSATPYPTGDMLAVGTVAPDFAAQTTDGKTIHLSDFKGKTVILDFWATWCKPCQEAMPHLESVYKTIGGQPATVLALCVWDTKPSYEKWVADKQQTYTFQTAFDPAGSAAANIAQSQYAVESIPTQYVIDKNGTIAAAYHVGGPDDHSLEDALIKLNILTKASVVSSKNQAEPGS